MDSNLWLLKDKSVLFAEDDNIARSKMGEILGIIFDKVYLAKDGEEALIIYEENKPDIIITDIKMPKRDGLNFVKRIRQSDYNTPIILLTSFAEQDLLLNAANLSIDAYLIKPVELDAIVKSVCQATKRAKNNYGVIKLSQDVYYNTGTKELYKNTTLVPLGNKELLLLELLINSNQRTISKDEIINELWLFEPICDSALKNIILRLRKKLGEDIIVSVRGIGYRLNVAI